jgi:hypothetical protein
MSPSPKHRLRALLLALLLAFGMSLPFVQGGMMAAEMAVSGESGHSGSHGCGGDEGTAAIDTCLSLCAAACHGLLPEEPVALAPRDGTDFPIAQLAPSDRPGSNDHGPPKSRILG